jgi:hypothetical protein
MNEQAINYYRDSDICYWYYLFEDYHLNPMKPQYFREKYELPESKFWNQFRIFVRPHPSPAVSKKFKKLYDEFSEGDQTIRDFCEIKKVRKSTFNMWCRHFMLQERINDLRERNLLVKPPTLIFKDKNEQRIQRDDGRCKRA